MDKITGEIKILEEGTKGLMEEVLK